MSNINEDSVNEETSETQDNAVTAAISEAAAEASTTAEGVADAAVEAAAEVAESAEEVVESATETVAEVAADVAETVSETAEAAADTTAEVVAEAAETVSEAAESTADAATEVATEAADTATEAADTVTEAAETAIDAAKTTVQAAAETAADAAETAVDAAKTTAQAATETAADAVEAVSEVAESATETAKAAAATAAAGVAKVVSKAAKVAGIGGESSNAEAKAVAEGSESDAQPDATMLMLEKALADKAPVKGQVIGWNKGGYHVAIEKIAAFCPVSQIEIGNPRSPKRYLDKSFEFRVLEIQKGGRRVVLSRAEALKAEREARAKLVRERLKAGEVLEGKVTSITTFGAFVDLGGGIEGLVHISELSRRRVEHPKELVQVGQEVKVTVLKIEKGGQRISLSMKRLEDDPWDGVADRFPPGEKITGKILRKTDFGMFVEVETGLEGLVHLSRLPLGMTLEDESLELEKEIEVWVHEVDSKRRRLSLSMREVVGGNPWKGISDRFPEGEIVTGTVERLTNFGVFIELEPGLTGLLPFSAIPGIANPKRRFHSGKEVSVRVLSIDTGRKRISLGTEASKAEGSPQDYREYQKSQAKSAGGMNALAAAFAKLKQEDSQQDQT